MQDTRRQVPPSLYTIEVRHSRHRLPPSCCIHGVDQILWRHCSTRRKVSLPCPYKHEAQESRILLAQEIEQVPYELGRVIKCATVRLCQPLEKIAAPSGTSLTRSVGPLRLRPIGWGPCPEPQFRSTIVGGPHTGVRPRLQTRLYVMLLI